MRWPRFAEVLRGALLGAIALAASDSARADLTATAPAGAPPLSFDGVPMSEHADDVADYTLHASLDPAAHTVHGEGTIRFTNTSTAPVKELWLHLYLNAFKNMKSVFLSEPVGFRSGVQIKDWGSIDVRKLALRDSQGPGSATVDLWPGAELRRAATAQASDAAVAASDDETDARVPLPREVAPGESITLEVAFDDKLPNVVARTGYSGSFHMVAQWFPKLARLESDGRWAHFPFHKLAEFYADYGTYDVTVDVPEKFVIGASGPVIESRVEGGRRIERHVQGDIHDFAWTAWDHFETLEDKVDGVALTVLYPRGFKKAAQREIAAMRFAIPHFGARYGKYPYPLLTLVHPPDSAREAGGMEYPTLITTGGHWYEPKWERSIEHVTIHEFGHQYFYGLVGTDEVTWPFLDEGVNEYATGEALHSWLGEGSLVDVAGLRVDPSALAATAARAAANEKVAQPAYAFQTGGDYGALVYERTASVLETLRRVYGDEAVALALGKYARRERFKHPTPDAFLASFEETLGADAARQLKVALFDKGWIDYVVGSVASDHERAPAGMFDRDGKRETVPIAPGTDGAYEASVLVFRRGTLAFPVDIELTFADGSSERRRWDGQSESTRLSVKSKVALAGVAVDPDHAVTIEPSFLNNHATPSNQSPRGAPRTLERLLYFAQLAVQAVSP